VVAGGAGALGGAALMRAERLRAGRPRPGALRAAVAALCLLGLAAGLAAHVPAHAARAWRTFTRIDRREGPPPADHLLRFDSNRYDYWRVAVLVLRAHPALGEGAGSFGVSYRALGRSEERPRQAHGEVWELAATLGLPGLALFAAVVGIGLAGLVAAARAPGGSALAAAALGACLVTVLHAQVDWDWQVPAAVLPAVSLLAAGAALSGRRGRRP
jgi:O-antigen ligase